MLLSLSFKKPNLGFFPTFLVCFSDKKLLSGKKILTDNFSVGFLRICKHPKSNTYSKFQAMNYRLIFGGNGFEGLNVKNHKETSFLSFGTNTSMKL